MTLILLAATKKNAGGSQSTLGGEEGCGTEDGVGSRRWHEQSHVTVRPRRIRRRRMNKPEITHENLSAVSVPCQRSINPSMVTHGGLATSSSASSFLHL